MNRTQVDRFLETHTNVVLATLQEDGWSHLTPVSAGYMDGAIRFTTPSATRKARNMARHPRVTLIVLGETRWEWLTVEGRAELYGLPEAREMMRDVYQRIAGKPHPDWDEYDAAMVDQRRVVVSVVPERMYPLEQ